MLGVTTMYAKPDHTTEVLHTNVKTSSFSKHTVVELLLVFLSILRSVSDALAVLLFGVTTPHGINRLLAG